MPSRDQCEPMTKNVSLGTPPDGAGGGDAVRVARAAAGAAGVCACRTATAASNDAATKGGGAFRQSHGGISLAGHSHGWRVSYARACMHASGIPRPLIAMEVPAMNGAQLRF